MGLDVHAALAAHPLTHLLEVAVPSLALVLAEALQFLARAALAPREEDQVAAADAQLGSLLSVRRSMRPWVNSGQSSASSASATWTRASMTEGQRSARPLDAGAEADLKAPS